MQSTIFGHVRSSRDLTIGLISSRGGHLQQMLGIRDCYADQKHFLVTTPAPDVLQNIPGFQVCYCITDVNEGRWRSPVKFLRAMVEYRRIFRRERPRVVISTGSGIAVPGFLVARMLTVETIFVEAGARVDTLSKAGRLCYYLANLFLVQHRGLLKRYPRALYCGTIYQHLSD